MAKQKSIIPVTRIENRILMIRGHKVIIDRDLAKLYGVPTKRLNEQVKRNRSRFPDEFILQLTKEGFDNLKSHFATSSSGWGGRRTRPYAFTEHGAIMAATVLNSDRAVEISVYVVRAFVKLRQMLATHKDLARKLDQLEKKLQTHDKHILALMEAIRQLMAPPPQKKKKTIGFQSEAGN